MPPLNSFSRSCLTLAISQSMLVPVNASIIEVNNNGDTDPLGSCTLRQAIYSANFNSIAPDSNCVAGSIGSDTILFSKTVEDSGTIFLTQPQHLLITQDLEINGPANSDLAINGMANAGVIQVTSSIVSLNNLTITGGYNISGAGINVSSGSSVSLSNSIVSGNSVSNNAGGIRVQDSSVSLNNSTVSGNSTPNTAGGIFANSFSSIIINNSTLSGNMARYGGGIFASESNVYLSNSTLSGNIVNIGGAIYSFSSSISLINSTVTGNSAVFNGGGVFTSTSSDNVRLSNSIISGNLAAVGAELSNSNGNSTFITHHNLLGDSNNASAEAFVNFTPNVISDITATSDGTQPTALSSIIAALTSNGGATQTHALVVSSPAIGAADASVCPSEDQRGVPRDAEGLFFPIVAANNKAAVISLDGECDMGSFEE